MHVDEAQVGKICEKYKVLVSNTFQIFRLKGLPYKDLGVINVNALKNPSNIRNLWALMKQEIPMDC